MYRKPIIHAFQKFDNTHLENNIAFWSPKCNEQIIFNDKVIKSQDKWKQNKVVIYFSPCCSDFCLILGFNQLASNGRMENPPKMYYLGGEDHIDRVSDLGKYKHSDFRVWYGLAKRWIVKGAWWKGDRMASVDSTFRLQAGRMVLEISGVTIGWPFWWKWNCIGDERNVHCNFLR